MSFSYGCIHFLKNDHLVIIISPFLLVLVHLVVQRFFLGCSKVSGLGVENHRMCNMAHVCQQL
jgi:hypothetical protein